MQKDYCKGRPVVLAIEGVDGSGKETQAQTLYHNLTALGYKVIYKSYPVYTSFFGREIGVLLSNDSDAFSAKTIDPKSMSLWYALDRWNDYKGCLPALGDTDFVLFNRYTLSSIVYQSQRSDDNAIEEWVSALEHDVLGLPRPDIYFILDVETTVSSENVMKKAKRDYIDHMVHDVYENDDLLQAKVRSKYLDFAKRSPNSALISCTTADGQMVDAKMIQSKILDHLRQNGYINEI